MMQRVIPNRALGSVSAVFLTSEAAATLTGAVAGPFLAQAAHLATVATVGSLLTLSAAALAYLTVPRMPTVIPAPVPTVSTDRRLTHNKTRHTLRRSETSPH
jgi:predicted MFS family arabinose efflux permease